ncbi:alternate-type signal peptide domain-containing protein [Cellulosimicrobium funkei]|nr:alternate-type signal peptide domain-containing protein [Cellulosimicrobium funkei]
MKKMTKGAIVTGLGVALLLGGGGTLATWNASVEADAGTIQSGNMALTAGTETPWTSKLTGKPVTDAYTIVPGEVLAYKQVLTPVIEGEGMQAVLQVTGPVENTGFGNDLNFTDFSIKATVNGVATELALNWVHTNGAYLEVAIPAGTTKIEANATATFNRDSPNGTMNASYDLSAITFNLVQRLAN